MKIQEQDLFHGAALTQIVEHQSFKALNRGSTKYGHYLVNADRHVFVKYCKRKGSPWQFTLSQDEIKSMAEEIGNTPNVWLCLVCGTETVCPLNPDEIRELLDLQGGSQQSIRVEIPKGRSCRVKGSNGRLRKTVPHKSFPEKVFS